MIGRVDKSGSARRLHFERVHCGFSTVFCSVLPWPSRAINEKSGKKRPNTSDKINLCENDLHPWAFTNVHLR